MPAYGRAGARSYAGHCGRGMASCDFRKRRSRKKTNKAKAESRKPCSTNLPAFIYFLITNRDETRLPLAAALSLPPSHCYLLLLLPLDPHSTLDWRLLLPMLLLLCETLNAKSEQNNTCSINASACCQLAGSQSSPRSLLTPPHPSNSLPAPLESGNLLKNIKKPAPRVNEKRTRTDEARRGRARLGARRRATCG